MQSLMIFMAETTRSVDSVPVFTSLMELLIRSVVFWAASADLAARLLTSSATMEKPAPAVPAREASTEAFNAKMFVWNAISSIVLITVTICVDDWSIFLVAEMSCSIFISASSA